MRRVLDRTDLAVLVAPSGVWGGFETELLEELRRRGTPVCVVLSRGDLDTGGRRGREPPSAGPVRRGRALPAHRPAAGRSPPRGWTIWSARSSPWSRPS